ncbi:fused response regulator/phosphatase [Cellvibrio fibrivorans]|uniref:DNA-binding response OmpR family regulator/anti-sigma regulatory factor (Ser/Thr protein kinase) n=1 Tax=Cellvibrio fibrivorans TaxID=126350 RepID=A0ABU1UZY0_9GAMM|nr:fused response regulator/phosphatase [Cellvibrio fibrivorans]MDR7090764.1 DNA-binding response OmpR family regulator/anti-sigma regulatory factor (Ser/Thr protein kinase) [Cellvibrio fibrivorans]
MNDNSNASLRYILVVDDDEFLNELFCQFLKTKGFNTCSAYSVAAAMQTLKEGAEVDLILLDYQLTDGNGLELLSNINSHASLQHPPVIMISGNEDAIFLESCFASGVADYIIKPVNLSLLTLKVSALINSVAMQRVISQQNAELEHFKREAEREESIAKFTYEYLLRQNNEVINGVSMWLKSSSSFSGDIALAKVSPSGDLYFLLADATGHGLSAAITVMPVVSIFNSMVAKGFHIQPIVTEINKKLIRDTPQDRFVAAILIQMHQERKEIDVWNGGMPTAYWVHQGEVLQTFRSQHMALGILEEELFDANVITCDFPGQGTIIAYSDGLIEEVNKEGNSFSSTRVDEIVRSHRGNLQTILINALRDFTGSDHYKDDVSICMLQPQTIFSSCEQKLRDSISHGFVQEDIGDFSWSVKISGKKIASCEIPPLCNKFLQYLGINQVFCQIIFLVVSEMVSNAIDHGILKLESSMKENEGGFNHYFNERERRLSQLTDSDFIELHLIWQESEERPNLEVSVRDSGNGYNFFGTTDTCDLAFSGRGLRLIHNLAQSVEIYPPGNFIKAIIGPS